MLVGIIRDKQIGGGRIKHLNVADGTKLYPRDVVLIPEETMNAKPPTMDICDLRKIMPIFDIRNSRIKNVLIIRSGGFGDLLALSSITEYLKDYNIYFHTQKAKFGEAINWHTNRNVKVFEHTEPVFRNFRKQDTITKMRTWGYLDINGVVEKGANMNWYNVFFEQIGVEFQPQMGRPSLIRPEISTPQNGSKTLLLCPKASASMRTINIADLIRATDGFGYQRQVHRYDISDGDVALCEFNNVKILDLCDHATMFMNIYKADFVVSTDTAAIHFREGVCKPALGIYSSFTVESRCKWYKYTESIDVKSDCELQSCYLHESKDLHFCPKNVDKLNYSPCLSGSEFVKQIRFKLSECLANIK